MFAAPPAFAASFAGDPAATCIGLAGAAWQAVRIDSAAMQSPSHLALSEHAPTPAARVSPANPAFCKVLGHIEPIGSQGAADQIPGQSSRGME